jgi:hypothetical protein
MALDFNKIALSAVESDDLTQNKSFERELPRAGVALFRLLSYVELGRHESKNPSHKPALGTMLTFELSHPDHMIEINGKMVPSQISVRLNKGATNKSGYKKLFNVMNAACGNKYNHFIQMIGSAFLGEIFHNESGEGDKKKVYANIDKDGAWSLKAPIQVDALTNTQTPIPVPELVGTPSAFLWENKTTSDADYKELWDSIYIEGTRTNDKNEEVSKNWIQERIMENIEWEGSAAQALFSDDIVSLTDSELLPANPAPTEPTPEVAVAAPAAVVVPPTNQSIVSALATATDGTPTL